MNVLTVETTYEKLLARGTETEIRTIIREEAIKSIGRKLF